MLFPEVAGIVDSGAAHSRKEVIDALGYGLPCPECGRHEVFKWEMPLDGEWVFIARTQCNGCGRAWLRRFRAGSGWADQPEYEDPRLTSAAEPTMLIPEHRLRETLEAGAESVRDAGEMPAGPPDAVEEWQDGVRPWAKAALESLLELEKLARARGQDPDAELTATRRWLAERFAAAGGSLPAELQG